jgi:hypothetical protein
LEDQKVAENSENEAKYKPGRKMQLILENVILMPENRNIMK